jgi:hypothetical protein
MVRVLPEIGRGSEIEALGMILPVVKVPHGRSSHTPRFLGMSLQLYSEKAAHKHFKQRLIPQENSKITK